MIKQIPTNLELKYRPEWGWYINVTETYPTDLISGWLKKRAYPAMVKRVAQLPKGDLREHMTKVLPDLYNGKVIQRTSNPAIDLFKSNEKATTTLYHLTK